jgi:DNA-binding response OmpR family regulator
MCYFQFEGTSMATMQKTVMIIEDEPDAADLFAEMMQLNRYRVLKTYSGTPAMALIEQEKPDLIILDIMMPGVSGLDVLRYLRASADFGGIPVVVVSARVSPDAIAEAMNAGATVYLTKPVSYTDLKNAVDGLVKLH